MQQDHPNPARSPVHTRLTGLAAAAMTAWLVTVNAATFAQADDLPPMADATLVAPAETGWRFTAAPYAWMAGLSGDVSIAGYGSTHLDVGFGDVFKSLDFVAMVVAEARYGRVALLSDFVYLMVSNKVQAPNGMKARLDTDVIQWTPSLSYSLLSGSAGHLDVVAGARLWSVETSARLLSTAYSYHADDQWIDAIGGIRGSFDLTDKLFVHGWALAGAGGSDLVWDLLGSIGYRLNNSASLMAGYRAQGVDYRNGGFRFDAEIKGPAISALIRF